MSRIESDEMRALRQAASDVLSKSASSTRVREVMANDGAPDLLLVRQMAELGWLGLEISEDLGGSGASFATLEVVVEEVGAMAASDVLVSSAALCVGALLLGDSPAVRERWCPGLAAGEVLGTVAMADIFSSAASSGEEVSATRVSGGWRLAGSASYVPNASVSQLVVVVAVTDAGPIVVALPRDSAGVEITAIPMVDATRCVGKVHLDRVVVADRDVLAASGRATDRLLAALTNRAAVAVAADAVGNARRVLEMTVQYAGQREQFGRPIGSFQAVKHAAANMMVDLEASSELVGSAAVAVAEEPSGVEAGRAASMAKEYACERGAIAAGMAVQLHGGIGYTWEHDLHIFLKRAKLNEQLFGTGSWHRERVARALFAAGGSR